ncbi:hypothetical protein PHAVU_L001651 [Phaseolus vulgaris]|uniref:Uncharacterized protein n=2 Tax=Phaseolus vulgaris TaxID=3885 RepID=A0ACC3P1U1_PHAVU|nr:hypothetical protein PHAVU_007G116900g [Phaseolus vulgaris]ESW15952.1 hypothetical protein PHAVU_007G116900g [Phaseolus vulgaris]
MLMLGQAGGGTCDYTLKECKRRFNVKLWKVFTECFNCLPVAALIDEKILCMQIKSLPRPSEVPETGLLCDLLWSDPSNDIRGWGENERGVSYTFGVDRVTEFLQKHDFDLICRAHQVVEDGYEFFADRQLVTIFSAPKYCGEFDNAGAMMTVDESLVSSFQILKPVDKKPIVYFALGALPQLSLVLQQKPSNHFLVLKHDLMNVTTISKCLVHRKKCLVFTLV